MSVGAEIARQVYDYLKQVYADEEKWGSSGWTGRMGLWKEGSRSRT